MFQSRAGFSECLDVIEDEVDRISHGSFNPVLGFLSVSTEAHERCVFIQIGFNPVLGFLSVSTSL